VALRSKRKTAKADTQADVEVSGAGVPFPVTSAPEPSHDDKFVSGGVTIEPETPAQEENDMSQEWNDQPVEDVKAAEGTEAVEGAVTEQAPEAPKEPEVRLDEQFPQGALVQFEKTDWKGQFGRVDGFEDKRNVQYISVLRTHYANGKELPADKQKPVDVRHTSLKVVSEDALPVYVEPAKKEAAPAEA
jgi:hypothetical protein